MPANIPYTLVESWLKADSLIGAEIKGLLPQQRLLLFSDGSLTLELELLYGSRVEVELKRNAPSHIDKETASYLGEECGKEAVEREVWLTAGEKRLVFAKTIIPANCIDAGLKKTLEKESGEPIGRVLNSKKIPFIKEKLEVAVVRSAHAADDLGIGRESLLLARRYVLFNRKEDSKRWIIKAAVTEIFSPGVMPCHGLITPASLNKKAL